MGNRLLPHRHRKAQQRRALCLAQKRTAAHDRRSPRQPPRRAPAMELAANERQRLSHVQAMDAYVAGGVRYPTGAPGYQISAFPDHCCFSQNDSRPCDAEPPITQGMPTATWPSAAAETQPNATAPTPTWPQKSRLRLLSEPLALSSSTAASASLRTAPSCTVSAAWITSPSGALIAAGCPASSPRRNSRNPASRTA